MSPEHNELNLLTEKAERMARYMTGYIYNLLSPEEHDQLDDWVAESDENMKLFEELTYEKELQARFDNRRPDASQQLQLLKSQLEFRPPRQSLPGRNYLFLAGSILVILAFLFSPYRSADPTTMCNDQLLYTQKSAAMKATGVLLYSAVSASCQTSYPVILFDGAKTRAYTNSSTRFQPVFLAKREG